MSSPSEIKNLCQKSLEAAKIGTGETEVQNGIDFYKFMFGNFPDLRVYFKGAEKFTPEDVQKSDRFKKQGQRILLACHILGNTFDDEMTFKAYARETVNRHRQFKMDPPLWKAFFAVFVAFLETKTKLDEKTKKAWDDLGEVFAKECYRHLKDCGLPTVEGETK
uniref:Globin family profile domain-containing protein n=1 Tax=Acrobeloides nanus TaxID=290746 RepID=A0A914DKM4_9BILA